MSKRIFIINFKNYRGGVGSRAVKLAMLIEEIVLEHKNVETLIVAEPPDVFRISHSTKLKVLSVADPVDFGRHTGAVIAEDLKDNGAYGLLINHSEDKINLAGIKFLIIKARSLGMKSIVCAENLEKLKKIVKLKPDIVAVEPRELIGGNVSVSTAKPSLIKKAYEISSKYKIPLLCGAGVKTKEDVKKAIEFGAVGVLVASGIVKAKNKKKAIENMLEGFI